MSEASEWAQRFPWLFTASHVDYADIEIELAARELVEGARATLCSELDLVGAHLAVSRRPEPYRSALSALSVSDAADYLAVEDQLMADVLQLTHALGRIR